MIIFLYIVSVAVVICLSAFIVYSIDALPHERPIDSEDDKQANADYNQPAAVTPAVCCCSPCLTDWNCAGCELLGKGCAICCIPITLC